MFTVVRTVPVYIISHNGRNIYTLIKFMLIKYIYSQIKIIYNRQKISLNDVSHNSAIGLVKRALEAGVLVTEVFVDTVGPAEKYEVSFMVVIKYFVVLRYCLIHVILAAMLLDVQRKKYVCELCNTLTATSAVCG